MRVSLNGYVVGDSDQWLYDYFGIGAFSPGLVRRAIAENPEGEDLELEINSVGGSVFDGFEIYSVLKEAGCKTVAIVQSLAASAASTVMSGCDEVRMSPVAQVMIHLPVSYAEGNQDAMKHEAKVLESITQSILNGYEAKCAGKASRAQLDRLIRAESWLTAQEAVDLGLADSITGLNEGNEALPEEAVNAAGAGIRAIANSAAEPPDPKVLMERYERLVRNGAPSAEGHPVLIEPPEKAEPLAWQVKARLDLEKIRFF